MVAEWKLENHNGGYTYLDAVAAAVSFSLFLCVLCVRAIFRRCLDSNVHHGVVHSVPTYLFNYTRLRIMSCTVGIRHCTYRYSSLVPEYSE